MGQGVGVGGGGGRGKGAYIVVFRSRMMLSTSWPEERKPRSLLHVSLPMTSNA